MATDTFGKYQIVAKIGEGGFGEVYRGRDPHLKRRVAIKTCHSPNRELLDRLEVAAAADHSAVMGVPVGVVGGDRELHRGTGGRGVDHPAVETGDQRAHHRRVVAEVDVERLRSAGGDVGRGHRQLAPETAAAHPQAGVGRRPCQRRDRCPGSAPRWRPWRGDRGGWARSCRGDRGGWAPV